MQVVSLNTATLGLPQLLLCPVAFQAATSDTQPAVHPLAARPVTVDVVVLGPAE